MLSHLNIKLRFIISNNIDCYDLQALSCLVWSNPPGANQLLLALSQLSMAKLTPLRPDCTSAGWLTQPAAEQVESHISEDSLWTAASPLLCLHLGFFSALLPHKRSKEMWLFKLMWQANAFILGFNELWTKFSMGAIWCMLCSVRMIPKILGNPIFGIKKLLYTTIPYFDSVIYLFIQKGYFMLTKSVSKMYFRIILNKKYYILLYILL